MENSLKCPPTKFTDLPEALVLDILARLPPEKTLEFKEVCPEWRLLLSSREFYDEHIRQTINRESSRVSFLVSSNVQDFHFVDYEDDHGTLYVGNMNFRCPLFETFSDPNKIVVGSCNGLVCIRSTGFPVVFIVNPLTRESFLVPDEYHTTHNHLSMGFGLSSTGQYKVVSVHQSITNDQEFEFLVYTVGDAQWMWTSVAVYVLPQLQFEQHNDNVVFSNGALYWKNINPGEGEGKIVVFDLATYSIMFIPPPIFPQGVPVQHHALGVLNGKIYYAVKESLESSNYLIWEPTVEDYFSMLQGENVNWHIKCRISSRNLLAVTLAGSVVGSIDSSLFIFEQSTADANSLTPTLLENFDGLRSVIPHSNTIVSMRIMGESIVGSMEAKTIFKQKMPLARTRTVDSSSRKRRREQEGGVVRRVASKI